MKKQSRKANASKKRFLNKLGMTYVELLCALSLLTLIIMMFTPMLLSSYETLYIAGERVEDVYDSKEQIETGLATRFSESTITISDVGFKNNSGVLFETMKVKLKKVVSSIHTGLETAFGTARASVDIVSPSIVFDDQDNHDIVIQTTGIEYSQVIFGRYDYTDDEFVALYNSVVNPTEEGAEEGTGLILIEVMIPNKNSSASSTDFVAESAVYSGDSNLATITMNDQVISNNAKYPLSSLSQEGRIAFNISGSNGKRLDFTQSPVRICIYYVNTREKVRSTSDYLIIEPPSMIFAGDTKSGIDYYTSAGVEKDEVLISSTSNTSKTTVTYNFENQARNMTISNSGLLTSTDIPSSTNSRIQTISWIDSDENDYFKPYYVMAGTNSSVYRMYNYSRMTDMASAFGNKVSVSGTVDTTDGSTILSNGTQSHPSFWSGEISDQFSFQTMYLAATYGAAGDNSTDCSAANDSQGVIGTRYNTFDKHLRYSMMFNSFRTGYNYASQMSRRISYVLTEAGSKSFRIAGKKNGSNQFTGYNQIWEQSGDYDLTNDTYTDDEKAQYFYTGSGTTNPHTDMHMAYLRLSSYTQVNPLDAKSSNSKTYSIANGSGTATLYDRFVTGGEFWSPYGKSEETAKGLKWEDRVNYLTTEYGTKVNVTSSVFLSGAGSEGQGQVIYFGTVPAYGLVRESSDIVTSQERMFNCNSRWFVSGELRGSLATVYLICGTQGEGTTIYRNAYTHTENVDAHNQMRAHIEGNSVVTQEDAATFYTTGNDAKTYKYFDSELEFTFGYCSRWRMTVGDVTYNGTDEETKSYEKYYKATNTSWSYSRKPDSINGGGVNNIYYNVWFPGEYYNLIHVATCDEVTVAAGYTVVGSSFMNQSANAGGYYGTALGSVYNDGVLAVYSAQATKFTAGLSGKGEQNVIFENCLYYKSPSFTNGTLHSRESIRFTAVGLFALTDDANQESGENQTVSKKYYAFYGDNHGNAYYSIVANSTVAKGEPITDSNGDYVYDESGEIVLETKESNVNLRSEKGGDALTVEEANPVLINDKPLSQYFSEITTIEAEEGFVVISGTPNEETKKEMIVILSVENGNWRFYAIENKDSSGGNFTGQINQAMLLGGYYYFCGGDSTMASDDKGWIAAVEVDTLKSMSHGDYLTTYKDTATFTKTVTETTTTSGKTITTAYDNYAAVYCTTETALYAIGGRLTDG